MSVKNSKKNKTNNLSESILYILIIIIPIILALLLVLYRDNSDNTRRINLYSADLWEKEFAKVEDTKVGIQFEDIKTTNSEYDKLRVSCNTYIEEHNIKSELDANINISVDINEYTYEDKVNQSGNDILGINRFDLIESFNNIQESVSYDANMAETGPIYFNDMLMIRYINTLGELKVVSSIFEDNFKQSTKTLSQSDLRDVYEFKFLSDISTESISGLAMNESQYIHTISESILDVITANTRKKANQAVSKGLSYLTYDGKDAIVKSKENLDIKFGTRPELLFGLAGKSDPGLDIKDRIYLQYSYVNIYDEPDILHIIIKLNKNLRLFDIDVI